LVTTFFAIAVTSLYIMPVLLMLEAATELLESVVVVVDVDVVVVAVVAVALDEEMFGLIVKDLLP
jgi:hypothetical protein